MTAPLPLLLPIPDPIVMRMPLFHRVWMGALAFALLLVGCGPDIDDAPPLPSRTEQAMALLPANARFAGMLDLQDLQQNGGLSFSSDRGITVRFLDSDLTFNPLSAEQQTHLQAFIDATGFEPGTDLHAAYVAGDSTRPQAVLLAAAFDRERLTDQLLSEFETRLDTTVHRGTPVFRLRMNDGPALQFALMNDGWMALSDNTTLLHTLIDRSLDAAPTSADDAMMPLVTALGGRGGAWFTLRDLPTQRVTQSADEQRLARLARAVRDAGTALAFTQEGVSGTVLLTTDQDPADLADVVRGVVSTFKLSEELSPEQKELLDRVTVTDAGGSVWITFEVPQETLARLLIQSIRGRGGERLTVVR